MKRGICRYFRPTFPAVIVILSAALITSAWSHNSDHLEKSFKYDLINCISKVLSDNYIFPEKAAKIGALLTVKIKNGEYDSILTKSAFARAINKDLQNISGDKHLCIKCDPDIIRRITEKKKPTKEEIERSRKIREEREKNDNFGLRRLEVLKGNIGYLDLSRFSGSHTAYDTAVTAMKFLSHTQAVIIDLRYNQGGHPYMIQLLSSFFLPPEIHLYTVEFRGTGKVDHYHTFPETPGGKIMEMDLIILTSRNTFSAAEAFAYSMKNTGRATLIGEKTAGGAHMGEIRVLKGCFSLWIPTGRPSDPRTGKNWEGVGVTPHISTSVDKALQTALKEISINRRRENRVFYHRGAYLTFSYSPHNLSF